jgi:sRNA-binding carbon storage regulator CsrA
MLVLNRRPGESIVIEPDLRLTVLSVIDRRVWIGMTASGTCGELRVSATVVSPTEARLEIVPMSSVEFEGDRVRITTDGDQGAASAARVGLAIDRAPGERVEVGDDLWVEVASISKGNPTITFGGSAIGDELSITLIRPAGSYVRLGVDAPNRRVYREELWDAVQASEDPRAAVGPLAANVPGSLVGVALDPSGPAASGLDISLDAPADGGGTPVPAVTADAAAGSVSG